MLYTNLVIQTVEAGGRAAEMARWWARLYKGKVVAVSEDGNAAVAEAPHYGRVAFATEEKQSSFYVPRPCAGGYVENSVRIN
jgi:hypothetical protein